MQLPVIQGVIRRRILVNFRVDPEVMQARLPQRFGRRSKPGVLAEEGVRVVGLVRLGVDVAEFAISGDLVCVVQIEHSVSARCWRWMSPRF